jgi:hypothetical protein
MSEPTPIQKKNMHHWPGIGSVAKTLSRSVKQVNQLVADGDLKAYVALSGERRFDPEQVNALLSELCEVPGDDDNDAGMVTAKSRSESVILHAMLEYTRELRTQNREQHQANTELQRQSGAMFRTATESKDETIRFLSKRVAELEATQTAYIEAREELLDAREDRDIIRARATARNEITQDIWSTTKKNFSGLMEIAMQRWGIDPKTMAKLQAANELIKSVAATPARLEALIETEMVSPEEAALIRTILDQAPSVAAGAPAAADAPGAAASAPANETEPSKTTIDVEPESETTPANQATNGDNET